MPCNLFNFLALISRLFITTVDDICADTVTSPSIGCCMTAWPWNSALMAFMSFLYNYFGCTDQSWMDQQSKFHQLLLKTLYPLDNCFGDCANHPARFVIITHVVQFWIFLIILLIFPAYVKSPFARLLRVSRISFNILWNGSSCALVANLACEAVLICACSPWMAVTA